MTTTITMMDKIRPLICILSPRELPEFINAVKTIDHIDKFWIKNHTKEEAYAIMGKTFLEHENQYTHLIPLPDDLVVTKNHVDQLIHDYLTFFKDPKYRNEKVIPSGFCNVDVLGDKDKAAISFTTVSPVREGRKYNFATLEEIRIRRQNKRGKNPFITVGWAGFPLMLISRQIFEKVGRFRNDSPSGDKESGCCYDVMFCYDAYQRVGRKCRIVCDTNVEMEHLKFQHRAITREDLKHKEKATYFEYAVEENTKKIEELIKNK